MSLLHNLKETNEKFNDYTLVLHDNITQLKKIDAYNIESKLDEIIDKLESLKWENERRFDEYSKNQVRMFEDFRRDIQV